jgi:hypothetical protein
VCLFFCYLPKGIAIKTGYASQLFAAAAALAAARNNYFTPTRFGFELN